MTLNPRRARPRHRALIRVTHWLIALSVIGLIATGIGILVSHPRLYWGETGSIGTPSLIDLPIPFILGPSIWNRPYHFFFAWTLVLAGLAYVVGGLTTGHFRRNLLPSKSDFRRGNITGVLSAHLRGKRTASDASGTYNVVQRLVYLAVVFVLLPGIVLTGLGMSPAVTSVFPVLATAIGGHQSARTLHFAFGSVMLVFVILHIAMLFVAGFVTHVRAMITGHMPGEEGPE